MDIINMVSDIDKSISCFKNDIFIQSIGDYSIYGITDTISYRALGCNSICVIHDLNFDEYIVENDGTPQPKRNIRLETIKENSDNGMVSFDYMVAHDLATFNSSRWG